jgi:O-antigen/teichoic acid export membrane protein
MTPPGSRARRVAYNTLSLSGSEIFSRFFTWLTIVYLVRQWSLGYYGQYTLAVNWVTIFSAISGLGLGVLAVRDVAYDKSLSDYYLRNIAAIRLAFSFFSFIALIIIGITLGYEPILKLALIILGLRLFFDALGSSYITLLQAHELMTYQGLISLASALLRMSGIVAVVYLGGQIAPVCWVWVTIGVFSLLALWKMGKKQGWKIDWMQFRWKESWTILKLSIPFAAFGTFQMLYYRVDAVILKSFTGNEAVALYDVAGRFLFVVLMLSDHFSISTLPSFSAAADHPQDLGRIATRSLKVLILLGIPLSVGGYFLADPLMILLFGNKYAGSGPVFAVLSCCIVFHFSMKPSINLLAVKDSTKLTVLFLSLFLLNVAANFIVIPRWGLTGAACVLSSCEVLAFIACYWLTRRYFQSLTWGFFRGIIAGILSAVIMGTCVSLDPRLYWLALGPIVYGAFFLIFRGFDAEDWMSLKTVFKIKK